MDATVTIEPHELPELTAFYREHEDPAEFECAEEIEVRIEDLEYEDGYAGDRFCPPGMLFIDAVDLAEHGKLEEAAARLEKAAAYLWGTARPKEWV